MVQEVKLVEPMVSVVRLEGLRFNWSDVIDEMLNKPDDGSKATSRSTTSASKGRIDFDDRPGWQKHVIADLDLGVPFVSNLPSQVETFVEPLLAMKVERHALRNSRQSPAFSTSRESVVNLKFDGLT